MPINSFIIINRKGVSNMKKLLTIAIMTAMFLGSAVSVFAAPWNAAENGNDPSGKFVAYYPEGYHTIPWLGWEFQGADLVMQRGNKKQFHQWFEGTYKDGEYYAIHTIWSITEDGTCPENWVKVGYTYPHWGDYMEPGAQYCVHNNYYQGTKP